MSAARSASISGLRSGLSSGLSPNPGDEAGGGGPSIPVLVLFGPTGSGKTGLLRRLFGPGRPEGAPQAEVVSADSMQVYRGLDIGTAKPSLEERAVLPHHLIDIRDPREQFNAGDFVREAEAACLDIARRGRLPVVSGGTGFYLKNLVLGLSEAPPSDPALREGLKEELRLRGREALLGELAAADPVSAARIHPNDTYRMLRALEVTRLTGRPLSSFAAAGGGRERPPLRFLLLGLRREREALYRRINLRCAAMFRSGLPAEARSLFEAGFTPSCPGLKAIGYKEFFVEDGAGGFTLSGNIPAVEALVAANSRRYAKRQMTFFASLPGVKWIDAGPGAADVVLGAIWEWLG